MEKKFELNNNSINLKKNGKKNLNTDIYFFFCGHKLHSNCLENNEDTNQTITNFNDENTNEFSYIQCSDFDLQKNICPLCFENRTVKNAIKKEINLSTTL